MLTEERKQRIIQYIDTNGGASVPLKTLQKPFTIIYNNVYII